jgi:hypothetical protein
MFAFIFYVSIHLEISAMLFIAKREAFLSERSDSPGSVAIGGQSEGLM